MSKAIEAEDLVIEFENQSREKGKLMYRRDYGEWEVLCLRDTDRACWTS